MIALDAQKYSAYIRIHEKLAMNVICLENSQSNIAIENISHMSWLLSGKSWGFTRGSVQLFVMNWGSSHERNTKTKTKGLWYPLKLFTSRFSRDGIGFLALLSEIYYFHAWWMTGALSQLLRPCAPIYLQAPPWHPAQPNKPPPWKMRRQSMETWAQAAERLSGSARADTLRVPWFRRGPRARRRPIRQQQ